LHGTARPARAFHGLPREFVQVFGIQTHFFENLVDASLSLVVGAIGGHIAIPASPTPLSCVSSASSRDHAWRLTKPIRDLSRYRDS
jgi:hypothetical protein